MKIKIVNPDKLGLSKSHEGKQYDAEKYDGGYIIRPWMDYHIVRIENRQISAKHAELIDESEYVQMFSPWGFPTP